MEKRTVMLSAGEISYHVGGEGPPVLHAHPAGGVRWDLPQEGLARSHTVFAPIAPGFDGTRPLEGIDSIPKLATLWGEFIDKVIGRNCDLIGHSFGGWVAAWLAILRPDRIEQLVLECPAGMRPLDAPPPIMDPAERRRALFKYPQNLGAGARSPEVEASNQAAFARYNHGAARDEALVARIGEIDKLTLILHGTEDRIIPDGVARFLRARIKHSILIYLPDAAHGIEVDQPERTLRLVTDFLQRGEASLVNRGT